ncbi:hypothetical protein VNO77_08879 [Canavalia gladiata]|uniref:Bromo domain-containing protein n=1 Tax=Canavalia gladiata TaxID=3824 RepID=A0AAN9MEA6_CANGL
MCDRKLHKAEGQRRSPRISALEVEAHGHSMRRHLDNGQGPAYQTRGRKNTKLKPLQQFTPSPNKGLKHSPHEDIQKKNGDDRPSKLPSSSNFLPEKRILQLVLDTLQRRDAYEIFAEPVDPNEVEDYYAIIKEPMDFGTMRAKLHEGMYESLEQFEARVINEIAKKVFDLLKNNPEKFESEFSETRRKVGRRNQGDFRDSTNMKSNDIAIGVPSKIVACSSRGTSNRKNFRENYGCHDIAKHVDAKDVEISTGTKDSNGCRIFEPDRRCTCRPLSLDENESIFSTVYSKLKLLEHVNQQDIGYKDSLKLFVKDLGPIAQNIAKRKLLGCEIHTASTSAPCKPNNCNTVTTSALMSQYPLDQFPDYPKEMKIPMEKIVDKKEKVEETLNTERDKGYSPLEGNTNGSQKWALGCGNVFPNQSFCFDSHYSQTCAEDLNCLNQGSIEIGKKSRMMLLDKSKLVNQERPSMSILENSQSNALESRLQSNCKFQMQTWAIENSDASCLVQDKNQMQKWSSKSVTSDCEAQRPLNEINHSSETMKILTSDQNVPLASTFVFNLPYLKTRLDQINFSEQYRFLQQDFSGKKPFSTQVSYKSFDL